MAATHNMNAGVNVVIRGKPHSIAFFLFKSHLISEWACVNVCAVCSQVWFELFSVSHSINKHHSNAVFKVKISVASLRRMHYTPLVLFHAVQNTTKYSQIRLIKMISTFIDISRSLTFRHTDSHVFDLLIIKCYHAQQTKNPFHTRNIRELRLYTRVFIQDKRLSFTFSFIFELAIECGRQKKKLLWNRSLFVWNSLFFVSFILLF